MNKYTFYMLLLTISGIAGNYAADNIKKTLFEKPVETNAKENNNDKEKINQEKKSENNKPSARAYLSYSQGHLNFGEFSEERVEEFLQYMKKDGRLNPIISHSIKDKTKDKDKNIGQELIFLKKFKKAVRFQQKEELKKLREEISKKEDSYPILMAIIQGVAMGTSAVVMFGVGAIIFRR